MAPTMATTTYLVLLFVALLPLGTLGSRGSSPHHGHGSHGKHSPSPPPAPVVPVLPSPPPAPVVPVLPPPARPAAASLVRTTCNSTAYYDICVAALAADPSSRTADVRGLSAIAVSAAAANASASATALVNGNGTAAGAAQGADVGGVQALLRACAVRYGQARDALGAARESIAQQDYDFAAVHVSAAAEYPQVCKALFRRQRPGEYPAELAAREVALKQLCSVALDIISLLSTTTTTN